MDFLSRMVWKHLPSRVCFLHAFWHQSPSVHPIPGYYKPQGTDEVAEGGWQSAGPLTHILRLLLGQLLFYSWSRVPAPSWLPGDFQGLGTGWAQRY